MTPNPNARCEHIRLRRASSCEDMTFLRGTGACYNLGPECPIKTCVLWGGTVGQRNLKEMEPSGRCLGHERCVPEGDSEAPDSSSSVHPRM